MKRLLLLLLVATVTLSLPGCRKMKEDIRKVTERVDRLEKVCEEMNDDIGSLEQLIIALQNNDFVTAVTPVVKDGVTIGYTISFSKSGHITIYNGESGSGSMPVIGVRKASDGVYYWTVNGEWLLDEDGNKVAAGGNSTTPKLKIESGYLYVSYDNALAGRNSVRYRAMVATPSSVVLHKTSTMYTSPLLTEQLLQFLWHRAEVLRVLCSR